MSDHTNLPIIPQHELLKRETCGQCVHFPGLPDSDVETIRTLGWKRCELGGVHTANDAPVETITFGRCKHFEPASPATKRSMTVVDRLRMLRDQAELDACELADGGLESLDHVGAFLSVAEFLRQEIAKLKEA